MTSDPKPARYAHGAVTTIEVTALSALAVVAGYGTLEAWPLLGGLPTPVVASALAFPAGAAARLALEAPQLARVARDQHRRAHRRIDQAARDRRQRQTQRQNTRPELGRSSQQGQLKATGSTSRSEVLPETSASFGSLVEGLKGPKTNEPNEDMEEGPEGDGRFPGLTSGNTGNSSQRDRATNGQFTSTSEEATRFWGRVHKPANDEGCWTWAGRTNDDGYGVFKVKRAGQWVPIRAHRWAYEQANGPTPLPLDHRCHTNDPNCPPGTDCPHRRCVRPDHLEPVSTRENTRRAHNRRDEIDQEQEHQP